MLRFCRGWIRRPIQDITTDAQVKFSILISFIQSNNSSTCTTTGHGCSNTNLCYYRSLKVLLRFLVTHLISVTISNVTIVWSIRTQDICSFTSKKVLLLCNTISCQLDHLSSITIIVNVTHFVSCSNTFTMWYSI